MSTGPAFSVPRDSTERLGPDDTATQREAEFLEVALCEQRRAAARAAPVVRGQCANCAQPLADGLVYCDDDCRADHETRLAAQRRHGHKG